MALLAVVVLGWPTIATAKDPGDEPPQLSRSAKPAATPPAPSVLPATPAPPADTSAPDQATRIDRSVVRERPANVNFHALDPQSTDAPATIDVELFDGQVVTLERHRVEPRGPGNYTWYGWIAGQDTGQAIFSVVDGQMAGSITMFDGDLRGGKVYQIQSGRDGTLSLRQIDQRGFPPDHPPGPENLHVAREGNASASGDAGGLATAVTTNATADAGDSGATIDVMVVYSNQTAAAAGATIGAQIQQAIDSANTAYANSGVATRLRLVHHQQVNYDESGNFSTDLNRLTNGADGYMDEVATLRSDRGADLVSLFVENGQYCGIAWIGPSASYGFSVVNRGCASGNLSFAHELGHNFGALHDPYADPSTSPYPHGHGLTDATEGWRTVMAYNNACAAAGTSCVRIPYFSTPNLTYGNPPHPLGTASTSDNVRVHNDNAITVANFRTATTTGCTYTLSPTSATVGADGGAGTTTLTTDASCAWTASSSAGWLTVSSATSGTGSATIGWSAAANTGSQRSANLNIGGAAFTLTEAAASAPAPAPANAIAQLSATSVKFGTVKVGATSPAKTVTLSNTGGGTLTIASLAISGTNAGDFERAGSCGVNTALAAGQSCTLQHTFTPGASGNRSASLAVATNAGTVKLGLSGRGSTK